MTFGMSNCVLSKVLWESMKVINNSNLELIYTVPSDFLKAVVNDHVQVLY